MDQLPAEETNFPLSDTQIAKLVDETLREWEIPGLSIAIVHRGKALHVAGYGVRERGKLDPVDADTLFQVSSLTKAFTATAIEMLVDERKLNLKTPVKNYLPSFELKDPIATKEMTLSDLLSHRTGLPGVSRQSWRLWYYTGRSSSELIERIRYVESLYPFRSHFTYNNVCYLTASSVAEQVTGKSWSHILEEKIFSPLKMDRTNNSHSTLQEGNNVAAAHLNTQSGEKVVPWVSWDALSAAAGINSCAKDMAKWMLFSLKKDNRCQSEAKQPHSVMDVDGFCEPFQKVFWPILMHGQPKVEYGFGWMMYHIDGKKVLFHLGLSEGMQSILLLIPDEELGICILTNKSIHVGGDVLMQELIGRFLHRKSQVSHQKGKEAVVLMQNQVRAAYQELLQKKKGLRPTLELEKYVGSYESPAYGTIRIFLDGKNLLFEFFTKQKGGLKHWDGDSFELENMSPFLPLLVDFQLSSQTVTGFKMENMGFFRKE